ncbi:MAG: GNAT family N-acetyltransferase [Alphaproteobacteria bacterium]|nr:GNAT family N-acetyltransferase [Alphaproteobacteria bacterium SS10]
MLIRTDRLVMRALRPADAGRMKVLLSDPDVTAQLAIFSQPPTDDELAAWVGGAVPDAAAGEDYRLGIYQPDTDLLIGNIGLHPKWPDGDAADFGYWLGAEFWGKGYASEAATRLIADADMLVPSLKKLTATTAPENAASIKLLERLGFVSAGEITRPLASGGERVSAYFERSV